MEPKIQKVINTVALQASYLYKTRENLLRFNKSLTESRTYQHERSKMIGMLDILDALEIDRTEYNWIF
jgi:hypothetical protein